MEIQIDINKLIPHPRNNEFFDDITGDKWVEFIESIKRRGIIEPIVITQDNVIVSGHQRIRAAKELGITEVKCNVNTYENEDQILQDLLETNIRQRGDVGGAAKKVGLRIKELERIYGIEHGNNQYDRIPNNFKSSKTQVDLAKDMNITVQTLQNYKTLADMIPELSDLVDTGIVTKTTALAIMKELSEEEQIELIAQLPSGQKFSTKQIKELIAQNKSLKEENQKLKSTPVAVREVDKTDYELVNRLRNEVDKLTKKLDETIRMKNLYMENAEIRKKDAEKYKQLKNEIDFLVKERSNIGRQIESATELAGLTVKLQHVLEDDLAPIKFKRCMEELDRSAVPMRNLASIIEMIKSWVDEMEHYLPATIVDSDVIEVE